MKKILALPKVIVFLITILVAGSCGSSLLSQDCDINDIENTQRVKIYLKVVNGQLEMYDSNDQTPIIDTDFTTCVLPGMRVVWLRSNDSGIRSIRRIGPTPPGPVMEENAKTILFYKRFRYSIPDDAQYGQCQKYEIVIVDTDNNELPPFDPYLEIPPPN